MADINGQSFYEHKVAQFNSQGSQRRFPDAYVRAVNRVLDIIVIESNASADIDHIESTEDDIGLDSRREFILSSGVDYFLVLMGHSSGDLNLATAEAAFNEDLDRLRLDRDQEAAAAATDSEVIAMLDDD